MAKKTTRQPNGLHSTPREAHWRRICEAWEASGLSQAEFCRRRGHSFTSFHHWRGELPRRDRIRRRRKPNAALDAVLHPKHPGFSEVRVISGATRSRWPLEIGLSDGKVIRVSPDVDSETLRKVLGVLEPPGQAVEPVEAGRRC